MHSGKNIKSNYLKTLESKKNIQKLEGFQPNERKELHLVTSNLIEFSPLGHFPVYVALRGWGQ